MQLSIGNRELNISLVRKDQAVKTRLSILDWFYRYFFGEDVFISYSRNDGDKYAKTLFSQLLNIEPKHTCYIDELGTEPGKEISNSLRRKIRTCSVFVLLGSPQSHGSKPISDEIAEFMSIATNRTRLIPIDFDGHTRKALKDESIRGNINWFENVSGIDEEFEEIKSLESGEVSETVINRIVGVKDYVKQTDRIGFARNLGIVIVGILFLLSSGLFGFSLYQGDKLKSTNDDLTQQTQKLSNTNQKLTETGEQLSNTEIKLETKDRELGNANTQLANTQQQLTNTNQQLDEVKPQLEKAKADLVKAENETKEAKQQTLVARKETATALKDKDIALREKDKAIDEKNTAVDEKIIAQNEAEEAKKEVIKQKDIGSSYVLASEAVETFNNKDFSAPQALIKLFDATEMSLKWNNYDALFDSPLRAISPLYPHHKIEELKVGNGANANYKVIFDGKILTFLDVQNNIPYKEDVSEGDYTEIKAEGISPKGKYIWVILQYEQGGVSETNNLLIFNTSTKKTFEIYDPRVFEFETNIFAVAFDENEEKVIIVSNSATEPKKTKLEYRILKNEEEKTNYTYPKDSSIPIAKDCDRCLASYNERIFAIENGANIVVWSLEYKNVLAIVKSELSPSEISLSKKGLSVRGIYNQKDYEEIWDLQEKACSQNNKPEIEESKEDNRIIWNFDNCLLSQEIDTDSSKKRKIESIEFDNNSQFLTVDITNGTDYRDDSGADEKSLDGVYAATTENNSTTVIVTKGNVSIMRLNFQKGGVWDIAFSPDNRWIAIAVNNIQEEPVDYDARPEFGTGEIFLYAMPEDLLKDVREKLTIKIIS